MHTQVRYIAAKVMGAKTPDEGSVSTMHLLFADGLQAISCNPWVISGHQWVISEHQCTY